MCIAKLRCPSILLRRANQSVRDHQNLTTSLEGKRDLGGATETLAKLDVDEPMFSGGGKAKNFLEEDVAARKRARPPLAASFGPCAGHDQ